MADTPTQAKKLVIVSLTAAGTLAALGDFAKSRDIPRLRILVGATVAAVMLTAVADFGQPEIASAFAVLILVSAILTTGNKTWTQIAGIVKG